MRKELTPSQALNDLIDGLENEHIGSSEEEWVVERKQIIEDALKALEIIKESMAIEFHENPYGYYHVVAFPKHLKGISLDGGTELLPYSKNKEMFDFLKKVLL